MMMGGQEPAPEHDKLAERFLDKLLPESRQISSADMQRAGIDPAMKDKCDEIVAQLTRNGIKPTMDQVVSEFKRQMTADRRRGI